MNLNFSSVLAIAKKDLRVEFRTKHAINFMLLFALLTLVVFSYTIEPFSPVITEVGPALLWIIFLFTGMLGFSRAFIREKDIGTLDGIKLSPASAVDIIMGKIVFNLVLIFLVEAVVFPLFIVFFNFPVKGSVVLAFFLLSLSLLGFILVGSAFSVLVMSAKARELLLPVILFPVLLPLIISSILVLKKVLVEGATLMNSLGEVKIILAYIIIMSVVLLLTFEYALEE